MNPFLVSGRLYFILTYCPVFGVHYTLFLLSIISFLSSCWALYGYALSKIIGLFFIPFLMLEKTSFLFDGWVRFFCGFLIYGIIARANLVLTMIAIKTFYGIPTNTINTSLVISYDFTGLGDVLGMVAFTFISILALLSTGRFAATIVSGAQGFGGSVAAVAYGVARMARGGL